MKMKKILAMGASFALVAALAIGGTMAYLTTEPTTKSNVFTVGDVSIELEEETGVFGEGGTVDSDEDGADYTGVMPGDYLQKKVTVENTGKNDAYVAVKVLLNNADLINKAIDEVYENEPYNYSSEQVQAVYTDIFDGWGINYNPRPGAYGVSDARGVIDGTYGLPEHVLHVDFAKTTSSSTVISAGNWFIAGNEKAGQYWVDNSRGEGKVDNGYYTKNMKDYEICYTYYMLLPAGESSTLFEGLNVPAEFNADQLSMFDGLKIDVKAQAIQADNMSVADKYKDDTDGKAKTAFAILAGDIDTPEYSSKPSGTMNAPYTNAAGFWGENGSNAKVSHVIKLYNGDVYMGETSLNNIDGIIDGDVYVTWNMKLDAASNTDEYWTMTWDIAPTLEMQPDRAELWVDGVKVDENKVQMNGPDNLWPIVGAVVDQNGTILEYVVKGTSVNLQDGEAYVAFVSSDDELNAAFTNGATIVMLSDGTYHMPVSAKGKTFAVYGSEDAVIEVVPAGQGEAGGQLDYSLDGSTVTFNGVAIKTNSMLYAGFARLSGTYNDCVIQNTYNLGTGNSAFYNCEINITNEYLRVGGASSAIFVGCTFNTDGRAILVFQDGTNVAQTVTVKDCTFNATAPAYTWDNKHVSAVSIDGTKGTYIVNLEGNNVVDSDFNGLWQIKTGEANVTVNE